jgi:hypothetical protein
MPIRPAIIAAALAVLAAVPAWAGDTATGWDWLAKTNEIQTEGAIWNDRLGDGKDRWKTGGLTQSYIFPERIFSREPWFEGRASALEINGRVVVMTPDNTAETGINGDDRPFAQYAGIGLHLRSIARPRPLAPGVALQEEGKIGVEAGWQGDPLPLFDIQDSLHDLAGTDGTAANLPNTIDGEVLVNLEARQTWRLHWEAPGRDVELAPFAQASLGMRENSLRLGADLIVGSALEGRTWGTDLATGSLLAGASVPRKGVNWTTFTGADVGFVASDAFLDGGFAVDGPSVPRKKLVARVRGGVLLEYDNLGIGFSLNWLGKEFRGQSDGQMVGTIQIKYRF